MLSDACRPARCLTEPARQAIQILALCLGLIGLTLYLGCRLRHAPLGLLLRDTVGISRATQIIERAQHWADRAVSVGRVRLRKRWRIGDVLFGIRGDR